MKAGAGLYVADSLRDMFDNVLIFRVFADQNPHILIWRCNNAVISGACVNRFLKWIGK
ncbi:hypothetical protein ABVF61_07220 [Roseibium sp. HPY-6]|uniref:hypothetical protein n=1 Tax=Roseibium sp. HPY-6 TaxID=3229852 RepID=UPI00338D45DF